MRVPGGGRLGRRGGASVHEAADAAKLYRGLCESAVCDADGTLALDARRAAAAAAGGAHRRRRGPPKANYYYRLGEIGGELWHDWIANTWWRVAPPLWHARHVEVALSSGGRAVLDCTTATPSSTTTARPRSSCGSGWWSCSTAPPPRAFPVIPGRRPQRAHLGEHGLGRGGVYARVRVAQRAAVGALGGGGAGAASAGRRRARARAPGGAGAGRRAARAPRGRGGTRSLPRARPSARIDVAPRRSAAPRRPRRPQRAADPAAAHWTLSAALPDELEARAAALTAASLPLIVKTQARVRLRAAATLVRAMLAARAVVRSWCAGLLRDARALRWRRAALRAYRRHKAAAKIGHACRRLLKKRREAADFAVTGRRHHVDFALTAAAAGGGARLAAQGGVRLGRVGDDARCRGRARDAKTMRLAKSKPTRGGAPLGHTGPLRPRRWRYDHDPVYTRHDENPGAVTHVGATYTRDGRILSSMTAPGPARSFLLSGPAKVGTWVFVCRLGIFTLAFGQSQQRLGQTNYESAAMVVTPTGQRQPAAV